MFTPTTATKNAAFSLACSAPRDSLALTAAAGIDAYDSGRLSAYVTGTRTDGRMPYPASIATLFFRFVTGHPALARKFVATEQAATLLRSIVHEATR